MADGVDEEKLRQLFALVLRERHRQQQLHGALSIAGNLPLDTKYRFMGEEFGEVAEAIDKYEEATRITAEREKSPFRDDAREHLIDELVQVAACALGIAESL